MRNTNSKESAERQQPPVDIEDFVDSDSSLGDASAAGVIDTTIGIKTISTGYCGFVPERCVVAKKRVILGRMGGKMFGVEDQLRNPKEVAEGKAEPDYGIALVGEMFADVYDEDGNVTEYQGGFCYLPGGLHERVRARFAGLSREEAAKGMRFSYFIAAEPSDNLRGYRYVDSNAERVENIETSLRLRLKREAALIASGRVPRADQEKFLLNNAAIPLLETTLPDGRPVR